MTISSMTGFGRADGASGPWRFQWEMRSVNGKSLDVRLRLPNGFDAVEQPIKTKIANALKRGNVQVSLNLEKDDAAVALSINTQALEAAIEVARSVERAYGGAPVSTDAILAMRGVVEHSAEETDDAMIAARDTALVAAAEVALVQLVENRNAEGDRMSGVIASQLDRIEELTRMAAADPSRTPEAIKARLKANIERILETSSSLDPDRLHAEAMLAATKADIQEELDRLTAHVEAARELLVSEEPVGRKFDFLSQEFNREANTLCSKSSDTSLTRIGLDLKTIIDQLREQVQNIE